MLGGGREGRKKEEVMLPLNNAHTELLAMEKKQNIIRITTRAKITYYREENENH